MTSYEERIKALAEEMQQSNDFMNNNSFNLENVFIPAARIAVKYMAEIELHRDEAIELLHSICMMLHDGDLVANSHTNDTYIRNKISKTIKAAGFLSQLENENKDE